MFSGLFNFYGCRRALFSSDDKNDYDTLGDSTIGLDDQDYGLEWDLQQIALMKKKEGEEFEEKFPRQEITVGEYKINDARQTNYKGKNLLQLNVKNQMESGGGASCGYQTIKNGFIVARALQGELVPDFVKIFACPEQLRNDLPKCLGNSLKDTVLVEKYMKEGSGIWRNYIIGQRKRVKLKQQGPYVTKLEDVVNIMKKKKGVRSVIVQKKKKLKDLEQRAKVSVLLYDDISLIGTGFDCNKAKMIEIAGKTIKDPNHTVVFGIGTMKNSSSELTGSTGHWFPLVRSKDTYYVMDSLNNRCRLEDERAQKIIDYFEQERSKLLTKKISETIVDSSLRSMITSMITKDSGPVLALKRYLHSCKKK